MAAGDFTRSELLKIKLKAEQMWSDSRLQADFAPEAEAARAVRANQTASMPELLQRDKDRKITVTWINACGIVAEDCETNCGLTEDELEAGSKDYEIDTCKKSGFSVDAEKSRTNAYEVQEIAARGQLMAIKALDEFWAVQVLAKAKAYAGVNVAPAPYTYDNTNKTTNVPDASYNVKMIANLLQQARLNKMGNPYFIDNGTLYLEWLNAQLDSGNLDGKGDATRIAQLKLYFDQFNFPKAGLAEDTFMISPGAMALFTRNRNPDAMTYVAGKINQWRYTVPSLVLPGVSYDAYQELACKTVNGKSHDYYTWRFETNGIVPLNPEGCPVTIQVGGSPVVLNPTGILSYTKV